VLLDGIDPIDIDDNATELFFKLVDFNPRAKRADLETLKDSILECITINVFHPTQIYQERIEQLFEARIIGDGWLHLDRIFSHMTGKTLSSVVDESNILYRPDDIGLDGEDLYSVTLKVKKIDSSPFSFHKICWAAIASDLDGILLLAREAINNHHLPFRRSCNLDNRSIDGRSIVNQPEQWAPSDLDILKNNLRVMALTVEKQEGGGYDIDWARALLIRPSPEVIKSIAKVAAPRAANLLKGLHLQDELGL
jgi:hypothetical protein